MKLLFYFNKNKIKLSKMKYLENIIKSLFYQALI